MPITLLFMNKQNLILPRLSGSDTTLSSIRETFKKVKEDSNIINLCIGDPDGNPPDAVVEAYCKAIMDKKTHYANDAGEPRLREIIADYENNLRGTAFHAYDNVVVSNGGVNGIYSFSRAVLDPGDEVLLLDPVWIAFIQITRLLRCKPVMVPTHHDNHFIPTLETLESLLTPRTKVLVVVSPGNPSGTVFDDLSMRNMVQFCEKHGLWLLHDEAYRDIIFSGHQQSSWVGHHPNVVGIRTLSKSHNMTGLRIGWVISSNKELIARVRKNIAYNVMCVNTAAQIAACVALEKCGDWLNNNIAMYERRMLYAYGKLCDLGFNIHWPRGSFYLFARHHYGRPIAEELLTQAQVAVVDGHHFGEGGKNHIRISCSVADAVLEEGLNRMKDWRKGVKS